MYKWLLGEKKKKRKLKYPQDFEQLKAVVDQEGRNVGNAKGRTTCYTGRLQIILSPRGAPLLSPPWHRDPLTGTVMPSHPVSPPASIQPEQGKHISCGYNGQHARLQCCRAEGEKDTSLDAV